MQPFELIGATSVPGALLAFGLSLYGVRVLEKGSSPRRDVALASTLKIVVQPVLAYLMAHFLLGIDGHQLFAIVVVSTLPTAQNVFIYASRYRRGMVLARGQCLCHHFGVNFRNCAGHSATRLSRVTVDSCVY